MTLQSRNFQLIMIAIIAILCVLCMVSISYGQKLQNVPSGIFQQVIVTHNTITYLFRRSMINHQWSDWEQWPLYVIDNTQKPKSFCPIKVKQKTVNNIIGKQLLAWLHERAYDVRVSGHYNFSKYKKYDWEKFAGDHCGTYNKKIRVYRTSE